MPSGFLFQKPQGPPARCKIRFKLLFSPLVFRVFQTLIHSFTTHSFVSFYYYLSRVLGSILWHLCTWDAPSNQHDATVACSHHPIPRASQHSGPGTRMHISLQSGGCDTNQEMKAQNLLKPLDPNSCGKVVNWPGLAPFPRKSEKQKNYKADLIA